uniref:Uncharacterized protein n=1 Tax=Molossus molossus TaxID=27622 RepID=A0A7J8FS44_MOLMO|nr:hypothetical protein HJG59_008449 [Molossus molossus]
MQPVTGATGQEADPSESDLSSTVNAQRQPSPGRGEAPLVPLSLLSVGAAQAQFSACILSSRPSGWRVPGMALSKSRTPLRSAGEAAVLASVWLFLSAYVDGAHGRDIQYVPPLEVVTVRSSLQMGKRRVGRSA